MRWGKVSLRFTQTKRNSSIAESGQPCDSLSWDRQEIVWADVAQGTFRMQDQPKGWSTESQDCSWARARVRICCSRPEGWRWRMSKDTRNAGHPGLGHRCSPGLWPEKEGRPRMVGCLRNGVSTSREGRVDMSVLCTADSRTGESPSSPSHPLLGKDWLLRNHGWLRETCSTHEAERTWLVFSHKRETEEIFRKSIRGLEVRGRKRLLPAKGSIGSQGNEIKQPWVNPGRKSVTMRRSPLWKSLPKRL